jgi:hypothetical protein
VLFVLVIICSAFITWLTARSHSFASSVLWDTTELQNGIVNGIRSNPSPLPPSPAPSRPPSPLAVSGRRLLNAVAPEPFRRVLDAVNITRYPELESWCKAQLPTTCQTAVRANEATADANVTIQYG